MDWTSLMSKLWSNHCTAYTTHWVRVTNESTPDTCVSYVPWSLVINMLQLYKIWGNFNAHECIKYSPVVNFYHLMIYSHGHFFRNCILHPSFRKYFVSFSWKILFLILLILDHVICISDLGMVVTVLRCFMEMLLLGVSHHMAKPFHCLVQHLLWESHILLFIWVISWSNITDDAMWLFIQCLVYIPLRVLFLSSQKLLILLLLFVYTMKPLAAW